MNAVDLSHEFRNAAAKSCVARSVENRSAKSLGTSHNYWLKRTGCKSGSAPKKSREESALFGLGVAPVPAF
jgi:hypothetical protein